jgi:hypothetical protein
MSTAALDHAQYLPGLGLTAFSISAPTLVCDWQSIGHRYTALCFVVMNDGAGTVTVQVEASEDAALVEAGPFAPVAFTVAGGLQGSDKYGVDVVWRYWRLRLSGTSTGRWGVKGIPR